MNEVHKITRVKSALTIEDVATELQCSKTHVQNMIHGRVADVPALPAVKTGRMYRVRRASLDRWLDQREKIAA